MKDGSGFPVSQTSVKCIERLPDFANVTEIACRRFSRPFFPSSGGLVIGRLQGVGRASQSPQADGIFHVTHRCRWRGCCSLAVQRTHRFVGPVLFEFFAVKNVFSSAKSALSAVLLAMRTERLSPELLRFTTEGTEFTERMRGQTRGQPCIVALCRWTFPFGLGINPLFPRQRRLDYPGAIDHVTSRGDRREPPPQRGGDQAWTVPQLKGLPRGSVAPGLR
jgi:hypothetical protein